MRKKVSYTTKTQRKGTPDRERFMTGEDRAAMGFKPRWHCICIQQTGKARPGKTGVDKARGAWKSKAERNARQQARQQEARAAAGKR